MSLQAQKRRLADDASAGFVSRLWHFGAVTNPLNCLATAEELDAAEAAYVDDRSVTTLYESAFHPDTGDRIPLVGRMCFQAPGCAILAACMLVWHRSLPGTLFLQWVNQSFMAVCNYSNRNAADEAERDDVLAPYLGATFGSMATAVALKRALPARWSVLVPAASISVASIVNVPSMRSGELRHGLVVEDARGDALEARSRAAAAFAVGAVTASRILNGCADLVVAPALVGAAKARGWRVAHSTNPAVTVPLYASLCFATLALSTPLVCSLVPQRSSLGAPWLDDGVAAELRARDAPPRVFFNKGL